MKKNRLFTVFSWLFFLAGLLKIQAQIRIEITKHPPLLVNDAPIFIACSFDNWNPGNENYKMFKNQNGNYYIDLPDTLTSFEYKFTQGNWTLVEGSIEGESISNRLYRKNDLKDPKHVKVEIKGWEKSVLYQFIIKTIPENTPKDSKIFITGNFNNWNPGDPLYQMQKQFDGTYRTAIFSDLDRIEYKFTRGDFNMVEGKYSGKARANRVLLRKNRFDHKNIEAEIESWEDLTSTFNFFSIYDLLLLFAAFQGVLLIFFIPTIQDYNRSANRWLVSLLAVMSLMIFLKVLGSHREFSQSYTKLLLLPDLIIFIFPPLFYFYLRKLLFKSFSIESRWWVHFIPFILSLFVFLPYFFDNDKILLLKIVNRDENLSSVYSIISIVGFIYNIYYWFLFRKSLQNYKNEYQTHASYEQNLQYLNTVLIIQALCLVLWFLILIFSIFWYYFLVESNEIIEYSIDGLWLVFSTIIYFLGYFAIHQPEIFKLPHAEAIENDEFDLEKVKIEEIQQKSVENAVIDENIQQLKEKIEDFMKKQKPFINPNLTLSELALKLKIPSHTLSKAINEGFDKNFFDLINSYRIEEFKQRIEDPRYKNYTFLGLAFEVGFNSKSAFNRSFKKITNQTPKEYFDEVRKSGV